MRRFGKLFLTVHVGIANMETGLRSLEGRVARIRKEQKRGASWNNYITADLSVREMSASVRPSRPTHSHDH